MVFNNINKMSKATDEAINKSDNIEDFINNIDDLNNDIENIKENMNETVDNINSIKNDIYETVKNIDLTKNNMYDTITDIDNLHDDIVKDRDDTIKSLKELEHMQSEIYNKLKQTLT